MPIVTVAYVASPDAAAKSRLMTRVTAALVEELGVPAEAVNVLLRHVPPADWSVGGVGLDTILGSGAASEDSPPTPQERRARSVWTRNDGLRLHALDYPGLSPAVVFVPGITSPAATWSFAVEALDLPNRVVILDNRGRGLSDSPESGFSSADYAGDIAAWCQELALDRPILLGHSMGARAVAVFAAQRPGQSFIAIDPPLSGPDRPYPTPLAFYLDTLRAVAEGATIETLRSDAPSWSDDRLKERLTWLPTCTVSAIVQSYEKFCEESFTDAWFATNGPALLIRGERSPVVTAEDIPPLARRPGSQVSTVASAGHMIPWDNLPGFVAAVRPWIAWVTEQ